MIPRDVDDRLRDIIERISRISLAEKMLIDAEVTENWDIAETAFDAILYDLVVIGEAAKTFHDGIKTRHPEIPWKDISGLRDILAHQYFRVNSTLVRSTIDLPLEKLRLVCAKELEK